MTPSESEEESGSKLTPAELERLDDLIDQFELAQDAGSPFSPERLCADCPELLQPLRNALKRLNGVDERLASVPTMPFPSRIGEFRVLELLGTGSTGMVFRCRQEHPNREVAVKVLKPLLNTNDQQRRFHREMAAFSAIREEGMAEVYQTGITDWCGVRCFWIAMELLDGGAVCHYTKANSLRMDEVLSLFRTICETLRAAHRLGILHRDIKPSNILMSKDRMPHLVDFGIAKLPGSFAGVQATETGTFSALGTAAWLAPELLLAEGPVQADVRSDIFSLGVVLFEMVSGKHPFAAERLSVPQVAARIAQREQASLLAFHPGASADLIAFVSKLMTFDAAERYQNLDDVLADLTRLQKGEPVKARSVPVRERLWRWTSSQWKKIGSVALGLTLLAGPPLLFYISRQAQELERTTQRLQSARKNAGRYLRLLDAMNIRPAMAAPQKPGDMTLQLELLREAEEAFEEFLFQWPEDQEIRKEAGSAFHVLGIAEDRLNLKEKSFASFKRAEQIFAELKRDFPEDSDLEFDLFHTVWGQSCTMLGTVESFELHKWCHQLIRRLHNDEPKNTNYADALACVLAELAFDYTRPMPFRNLTLARELALESHQIAQGLASHPNCKPLHRKHIATSAVVLRLISEQEHDYIEAQEWAATAVTAQERFMKDFPEPQTYVNFVSYQLNHVRTFLLLGNVAAARDALSSAKSFLGDVEPLLSDQPELTDIRNELSEISAELEAAERDPEQ